MVERYWKAGPSSVCLTCCGIGHKRMGSCGNRPPKYIIWAVPHKVEEHCCVVAGYNKREGKICVHVTAKYANCGGNHVANFPRCVSRHKADIKAKKERKKTREKKRKEKLQANSVSNKVE